MRAFIKIYYKKASNLIKGSFSKIKAYVKKYKAVLLLIALSYIVNNLIYQFRTKEFSTNFLSGFYFSVDIDDVLYTIIGTLILFAFFSFNINEKKKRKQMMKNKNEEYGSSKWADKSEIEPFINKKDPLKNIIFTETERLTYETHREDFSLNRNHNSVVVGMPGTGKTWLFILSNLLQGVGSNIITDTKGQTILDTGYFFSKILGKNIKIFNTKDTTKSMKFNPFSYIRTELDILKTTNTLMKATEEIGTSKGEKFWRDAEQMFMNAIIGFLFETMEFDDINIGSFLDVINKCRVAEEENPTEEVSETVDEMFKTIENKNPNAFCVRQYNKYLSGAEKSKSSIILSACARTSAFDIQEIRDLMEYDELDLDSLAQFNTILYIITSDSDRTLDFVTSWLYTLLIQRLYDICDNEYGGEFKEPISFYFDEFRNLNIPNFEGIISTNRSRNIPIHILIQSINQLKEKYRDTYTSILGNCDSYLFLGSKETDTLKDLEETLDKATIVDESSSKSFSSNKSYSFSERKIGRSLMTRSELVRLDQSECIYILRGLNPFRSKKFIPTKHDNYKYVYNKKQPNKNKFDIDKYLENYRTNNVITMSNSSIVTIFDFEE